MRLASKTHENFKPSFLKPTSQEYKIHWSKYENPRPKNIHRRVDSDLIFACVSLIVLLLFAAADTAFRF